MKEQDIQAKRIKSTILIDGTSSAGKSWVSKELNAVPFYKSTDSNQLVIIASDDFNKSNTNTVAWYMAQVFNSGKWNKVIFDDVTNDILNYVPNVNHILLHAPIYMLINNILKRNKNGKKDPNWREPTKALVQYLKKYEATKQKPHENKGDPSIELTKNKIKTLLSQVVDNSDFIDSFIICLGLKDNDLYYIKVKDEYITTNPQLINIDLCRIIYLDKFKKIII